MVSSFPRLTTVAPQLAASFLKAGNAKQIEAARAASAVAVSRAGLAQDFVAAALEHQGSVTSFALLRGQIEALARQLDSEYLELSESEDERAEEAALRAFSKARAAAALAYALSRKSADLIEAVYEAMAALDDPAEVIEAVDSALR